MSGLPAAPDKFTFTRSTERGMSDRMSSELHSVLDARLPRQGGTSAGQVYVYKKNCDPDMAEHRNGFASEVSARSARGDRESLSVHPSWLRLIRYCAELGHGEIEKLKIQDGLPMAAEVTTKKVRFGP